MNHSQAIHLMGGAIMGMKMVAARPETSPEKREKLNKQIQELCETLSALEKLSPAPIDLSKLKRYNIGLLGIGGPTLSSQGRWVEYADIEEAVMKALIEKAPEASRPKIPEIPDFSEVWKMRVKYHVEKKGGCEPEEAVAYCCYLYLKEWLQEKGYL